MRSGYKILLFLFLAGAPLMGETKWEPEYSSGWQPKAPVFAKKAMVASANPLASQAGFEILKQGGNAVDALVAVQMVLTLVEPQSSGLGGGAFLLYFRKKDGKVFAYDGREAAPAKTHEDIFLDKQGNPLSAAEAIVGGRSVGAPGLLKMLELAHQEEGKLNWPLLFDRAITLSEKGFPLSSRLYQLITKTPHLGTFEKTRAYLFQKDGAPKQEGTAIKNLELASTFRLIAAKGSQPFYEGEIAEKIVQAVNEAPVRPGSLSLQDLAGYRALKREPIRTEYRHFILYGFPPPSSGGIAIAQILGMLARYDLNEYRFGSAEFIQLFCQASRLAFADRDYYIADPAYFPVPVERLTDSKYIETRSLLIEKEKAPRTVNPGGWPGLSAACCPPLLFATPFEFPSTSQICIVDAEGNAACMTTSIENAFGSTLMAGGFFLNNQLTDFSFVPQKEGKKAANRAEPGKRPMSAMSPTIAIHRESGQLFLLLGSAGGARIIDYVAQALVGVIDYGLNIQQAIDAPHYTAISNTIDLERGTVLENEAAVLKKLGNPIKIMPLTSGTQGIQLSPYGLIGGADPRREGMAVGE